MAANSREISEKKFRVACSYESWLSVDNSDITVEVQGRYVHIPTVSNLEKLSQVDAVLIVGDNFRAAAEAAVFLSNYNDRLGKYPEVVCMPGLCTHERVNYEKTEFWLKLILVSLGLPKEVVKKHSCNFEEKPIEGLKSFLKDNQMMKKIVIFSSRGFSINVAQELMFNLPKYELCFYNNPFIAEEDRVFESEIIGPDGFAIDLMIANIIHTLQDWHERCSPLRAAYYPEISTMREFAHKGYVLGINDYRDATFLTIKNDDLVELLYYRQNDFLWFKKTNRHIMDQIKKLIAQYQK